MDNQPTSEQWDHDGGKHTWWHFIAIAALILSLLAILISFSRRTEPEPHLVDDNSREIASMRRNLDSLGSELATVRANFNLHTWGNHYSGFVELTDPSIQTIDAIFLLARSDVNTHLNGVKVTGRIINTSSITYVNPTFKISVGESENTFWVSRISPGNSTAFSVHIPNARAESARYGTIKYQSGSVNYQAW